MKLPFLAAMLFSWIVGSAQCTFERHFRFYPGTGNDMDVIRTSDGGIFTATGAYHDSLHPGEVLGGAMDMCMLKTDSCGNTLWKYIHGSGIEDVFGVGETSDGRYLVGGYTETGQALGNIRVLCMSSNGVLLWDSIYTGQNTSVGACMMKRKGRGSFLISGYIEKATPGPWDRRIRPYLLEIDEYGRQIRSADFKVIGSDTLDIQMFNHILQPTNESYLAFGSELGGGDTLYVYSIDTSFNVQSVKRNPWDTLNRVEGAYDAVLSNDSSEIVLALKARIRNVPFTKDIFLRVDTNMTLKNFTVKPTGQASPTYVASCHDGGYLVGPQVTKLDKFLKIQAAYTTAGRLAAVLENKDKTVVGVGRSFIRSDSAYDELYLIKMDSAGNYQGVGSEDQPQLSPEKIRIYPNPTTGQLHFENPDRLEVVFKITDYTGTEVQQGNLNLSQNLLDFTYLPSGIYFVRILTKKGTLIRTERIAVIQEN